ncbi:MAG TPA: hypothetical protein VFC51_12630 [Chloroflexota bacterium]|nr:hypothetical protein [Chloroflexota bacterium]
MQNNAPSESDPIARLKPGQKVLAGHDEVGEAAGVVYRGDAAFLHIIRYGAGKDELFVPVIAIDRVVGDHVYLHLDALDLAAKPWHEQP